MRWVDWFDDGSLAVVDIGLACCALEFEAAAAGRRWREEPVPPGARTVVVVSGTVTDALAPAVESVVAQLPGGVGAGDGEPDVQVVSFGACTASGGPYWDSYAVTKGIDQIVDVAHFVPGCPPPPSALDELFQAMSPHEDLPMRISP